MVVIKAVSEGISVGLNDYSSEAYNFLKKIGAKDESFERLMEILDEEMKLLRQSGNDPDSLKHQIYDVLFILFEVSGKYGFDLDSEWDRGRERKQKKYMDRI